MNYTQHNCYSLEIICYNYSCHLLKYAANKCRSNLTETAARLSNMKIVIDRMHFKGHIDQWCRENCNPDSVKELQDVSTTIIIFAQL